MATPSSGWRSQQDVPLPRALDLNKFASAREPEVLAITEALKTSELGTRYGVDGIPRHLRRRTRSHNPYKHRRRPNATKQAILQDQMEVGFQPTTTAPTTPSQQAQPHPPFTNRKMRRRPAKLAVDCLSKASWSQAEIEDYKQVHEIDNGMLQDSPPSPPPPSPRRLETHVWHAKRLSIVPTWNGWVLPEGESGRGRGTRAFVRKLSTGAVIHDASYWCPVLLSGPFTAVTRCLNIIIDPEIVKLLAVQLGMRVSNSIGCEIEAMLHEMHCFPAKALSPVKILALPSHRKEHKEYAKLYIWIHGAGIKEAFRALKAAVDTIKNTTGECVSETAATAAAAALVEATPQSDNLSLVVGDARRIEMRGSKSDHVLLHALFSHNKTTKIDSKPCLPQKLRSLRPGQAALVVLPDPRLSKPIILGSRTCSSLLDADSSNKVDFDIFNHRYPSPSTEAAISQARKDARHQLMVAGEAATDPRTQGEEEEALTASLQGPTHCGAIFIRGYKGLKSSTGWSIILPPGWVMPIWVALAFQGCRATGQREWRWLHTLDHRSLFPYDVPDSHVYNTYIEKQHEHRELKDKKRPPAKRFDLPQAEGVGWEHLSELYINSNERSSIEVEGRILSTRLLNNANVFVARSESSMLQALFGWAAEAAARFSSAGVFSGSSLRPVANALASRKLQWVPRNVPKHLGRDLCLVEAAIHIINQGVINENATIFVIWKHEAQLSQGQPCYLKYKGTYHPEEPDTRYAEHEKLIPIGFITSPAPQATGRETASMAVVTAAAFWRLRSLQYSEYRRDRGTVEAWIQNSRSSVIYPVRLSLLIERK